MQVNNNVPSVRLTQAQGLPVLKIGRYIRVEIIAKNGSGQGVISMAGKYFPAQLETNVRVGDKFWASVREFNQNSIILKKENISNAAFNNLALKDTILLENRGLSFEPRLAQLVTRFITAENSFLLSLLAGKNIPFGESIKTLLKAAVPSWQTIKENNRILNYFRSLGINTENLILKMLKNGQDPNNDFTNVKLETLKILAENSDSLTGENKLFLAELLKEITGQQLWYQTGVHENAYSILHFPLEDNGKYYLVKVAIEGLRKGFKIDPSYCHLALQLETPNLGQIGLDLLFYDNDLTLSLIYDEPEVLKPMLEITEEEVKENFSQLGITLKTISLKKKTDHPLFEAFINGQQLGGVDFKG